MTDKTRIIKLETICPGNETQFNGTKVDFLSHAYPQLERGEKLDDIRLISISDLAAMKINALTNRGSKKDFSDLYLLDEQGFKLSHSLKCFCDKYGDSGRFLAIRSLMWFENATDEPDPVYLNNWTWKFVQENMNRIASELLNKH